jgi:hypothetical protein
MPCTWVKTPRTATRWLGGTPAWRAVDSGKRLRCRAVALQVYVKPDCPLCDGIVEKLAAIRSKADFAGGFWADATVQVSFGGVLSPSCRWLVHPLASCGNTFDARARDGAYALAFLCLRSVAATMLPITASLACQCTLVTLRANTAE